ncbi:uncharacterized protein LOC142592638 isoform X2 [Dermacentor variabilis]|uniref:uncharacterized protein LOC142592638 isoform X2 n=1 Tax=Dermacentor variabilis TaxID=34621 RepID=UPI003F5B0C2D
MDACDAPIIEDRVVRSSVPHQPVPDADYATYLRSVWGKFKDRTALVHSNTGERYTYGELEDACNRVAAGLASLGFGPGDMAGIHCETGLDAMVAFYGTAFAGGSMVFAKASLTAREVKYDFEETKPCIVFCDEENATKAQEACKTIPSVKATVMFQFPTILQKLVRSPLLERYDVSSVKKVYVGGSATPSVTVEETLQKFNLDHFGQVYSMSESFGSGMISHKGKDYETVGPPTAMTKVKVVDVNTGEKLGPKETGEIRMKSPTCVSGYMNNSEATANLYDEDGFMRTGDIGYYNESGEFYVMDRIKDMFKCMDRQVAPSEIEEVLTQHEAVKEAAVAGVPHSEFGEAPRAFVVLNAGYAPSEATAAELRALVSANTAPQKHLHGGVEFVSTIPKSDTGKNLRKDLRNAYLQRQAARGL